MHRAGPPPAGATRKSAGWNCALALVVHGEVLCVMELYIGLGHRLLVYGEVLLFGIRFELLVGV